MVTNTSATITGGLPFGHHVYHADNLSTTAKSDSKAVGFLVAVNDIPYYLGIGDAAVFLNNESGIYFAFNLSLYGFFRIADVPVRLNESISAEVQTTTSIKSESGWENS